MPNRKRTTLALLLFSVISIYAQNHSVSGVVLSADNKEPISYATVMQKSTNNAVISGLDGQYTLELDQDDAVLVFSFMGMLTQEHDVQGRAVLDVMLQPAAINMNELVVTALGISREKKSLGYSSQVVASKDMLQANPNNAISALSGRVAGLQVQGQNFGGSQNILIRGASSFSGNNQPLFVVDGIPLSNENFNTENTQKGAGGYDYGSLISDLNPNDIASIDVLKGSAASALYGSRGQNGVIMVTSKSGKSGKKSFSIDINSGVTFERVTTLPQQQNTYGGGYSNTFDQVEIDGISYDVVDYQADESWGPKFDASLAPIHWWGMSDYEQGITSSPETAPWVASSNDVESFYDVGVAYQNSINIISSSLNQSIRLGYTNVNMTGVMPNSEQDKNTFNLNTTNTVLDGLIDIKSSVTFVKTNTKGRAFVGLGDSPSQVLFQWGQRQLDMHQLENYANADGSQRTWNRSSVTDASPLHSDNPYWSVYKNWQDDDRTRLYGNIGLVGHITDDLTAEGNLFLDTYTLNVHERVAIGSQQTSSYSEINRQGTETNYEGKLNYIKVVNDIDLSAMLGANLRHNTNTMLAGTTSGGLVLSDLWNLDNSIDQAIIDDYDSNKMVKSLFTMLSAGWRNMAYVDMTYRMDYDSSLPENNNSYDYFSTSASFIVSELIDADAINLLKLRLNYGETGNGTDPYQVYNTYEWSNPFNGSPMFENGSTLNNSTIRAEETKEVELGLEGAFLENRLGFDFSWYNKKTYDQILAVEVSGASGYTHRMINAGTIRNRGVELVLFGTPIHSHSWQWDVSLNFAKNNNLVLDLPDGIDKVEVASANYSGAVITAERGATFQELYGYDYAYDDEGNKIINAETGFYEQGEYKSLGSVLPDYTAGFYNKIKYKNFDLGILLETSQGGVYYSLSHVFSMYSGMHANTATPTASGKTIREDGIIVPGVIVSRNDQGDIISSRENDISISGQDYSRNHFHVFNTPSATGFFDASYIKLREVSLGYTLPPINDYIKNVHISFYGRNLAVWGLDNDGIDPETYVSGSGNIQGIEAGVVPGTESYGFNLRFSF